MSERFYINWPLTPGPVELTGAEAHHLGTVRRFRAGDAVCLFNGDGREYAARVVHVERRRIALEVINVASPERELPYALELAAPLPKGDRGQFLVEKLTELGVTRFLPLTTERSVVHPREGELETRERWVIQACKQCGRNVLMQVAPAEGWASYCRHADSRALRVVAHPGE